MFSKKRLLRYCIGAFLLVFGSSLPSAAEPEGFTLQQAIQYALEHNPALLASRHRVEGAEGAGAAAAALRNPEVRFGPVFGSEGVDGGDGQLSLSQLFEISGARRFRARGANRFLQATRHELEAAILEAVYRARSAYIELWRAQEQVALRQEALDIARSVSELTRQRSEAGDVPYSDVVRAEVSHAEAEVEFQKPRREVEVAAARLNEILGRAPGIPIVASEKLVYSDYPTPAEEFLSRALELRSEIQAAKMLLLTAEAAVDVVRSQRRPDLQVGVTQSTFGADRTYGLVAALSAPLLDLGSIRGEVRASQASVREAKTRLTEIEIQVESEVRQALARFAEAGVRAQAYQAGVLERAAKFLDMVESSYRLGQFGILEVLDAQNTWLRSRTGSVDAIADYHLAIASLERASGVLTWRETSGGQSPGKTGGEGTDEEG